jgi:hypothetical protein
MSSTTDSDNVTSTTSDKHHIILIYFIHGNGLYEGGFYARTYKMWTPLSGQILDAVISMAYFAFEVMIEEESDKAPVNTDQVYDLVEFDPQQCMNLEKWQLIDAAGKNGAPFEAIVEI